MPRQVYIHALSPRKIEFDVNNSPEQGTRKPKLLRSASASTRAPWLLHSGIAQTASLEFSVSGPCRVCFAKASSADVGLQTWPSDDRREGFSRRVPRVRLRSPGRSTP